METHNKRSEIERRRTGTRRIRKGKSKTKESWATLVDYVSSWRWRAMTAIPIHMA